MKKTGNKFTNHINDKFTDHLKDHLNDKFTAEVKEDVREDVREKLQKDKNSAKEILAEICHLQVTYQKAVAVEDVSFSLQKGEILAIIGANGSGKTSVVECLEGLRKASGGSVMLLGCDPYQNRRFLYKEVGIQLQDADYPDHIRVGELCRLFASFYREPADWKRLLSQFGLEKRAAYPVKKLSGGEKQRLSILLALLPRPKLLILDELTTGLDPEIRRAMWESLKQIRQHGTSILLVSHSMDEVAFLADRLLYMEKGRSAFLGSLPEFKSFVQLQLPKEEWKETLSFEDLYLFLSHYKNPVNLEDLL